MIRHGTGKLEKIQVLLVGTMMSNAAKQERACCHGTKTDCSV